jgi:hypothetical protein
MSEEKSRCKVHKLAVRVRIARMSCSTHRYSMPQHHYRRENLVTSLYQPKLPQRVPQSFKMCQPHAVTIVDLSFPQFLDFACHSSDFRHVDRV